MVYDTWQIGHTLSLLKTGMEIVTLKPLQHNGEENIGMFFSNMAVLNNAVRIIKKARWTRTHKCWYVPLNKKKHEEIVAAFKGLTNIEQSALKEYLDAKRDTGSIELSSVKEQATKANLPVVVKQVSLVSGKPPKEKGMIIYKGGNIHPVNVHILPAMEQRLKLKAYSPSTIKTYLNEMTQLLTILKNIPADDLTAEHLKRYLVHCYDILKLSENTLHSRINAMKFYFEQVLKREKFFWDIPRPKKPLLLPKLLNEKELSKLFNALENKKHKAMLFTAYSAGLRVSEIVHLKIADIDSGRMQIMVAQAKGKKDRYVNLSPVLLDILRKYIMEYKPRPEVYLFESEQTFTAYPTRTVQQIFSNAKLKAGIRKEVGIHSLRHSFATHLLDKGTDIKYIKDLLGHFNIKTTERYLHVSKKQLVNIVSPFDDLWKKEQIDW